MSPDPGLVERLREHGQSHLLRCWEELNDTEQARLAADVGSIDFVQLDRLIAELVRGDGVTAPPHYRVQPIDVVRLPQTDGEHIVRTARGQWVPTHSPRARSVSSWSPAARGRGWASRDRKERFRSGRFHWRACFRSMPRRSSLWLGATGGPSRFTS